MERPLGFFNEFDRRFQALKASCADDPSRVEFLIVNSAQSRVDIFWLYDAHNRYSDLRNKAPFLRNVPKWFISSYAEFTNNWWPHVEGICGNLDFWASMVEGGLGDEDTLQGISSSEIVNRRRPTFFPHSAGRSYFYPGAEYGAFAIDQAVEMIWNDYELDDEETWGGDHCELLCEAIEAWDYFREEVKIDFSGIERRWKSLPRAMIPPHVSTAYTGYKYGSIDELLEDTVRAYIHGAQGAAVAMCRTLSEAVLKKYYAPECVARWKDMQEKKRNLKDHDPPFGKVIAWAGDRFESVRSLDLGRLKEFGDAMLHHPGERAWSDDSERMVIEWMLVVKRLIEKAPKPK